MTYTYKWPRYKVTADIVICDSHSNSILAIRRSAKVDLEPEKYSFPGGNLEPDELLKECAIRENLEEIGLKFSLFHLHLLNVYDAIGRAAGDRSVGIVYYIVVNGVKGLDITLNEECDEYHWVMRDEVDKINWAFDCKDMALDAFSKVLGL